MLNFFCEGKYFAEPVVFCFFTKNFEKDAKKDKYTEGGADS